MIGKKQDFNISLSEYPGEVCLVLYHSPCFLHCNWCFNKNNLTNTLLTYDSAIRIIEENREFITSVCLTGGEPLLHPKLKEIVREFANRTECVALNTNASLLKYEKILELKKYGV